MSDTMPATFWISSVDFDRVKAERDALKAERDQALLDKCIERDKAAQARAEVERLTSSLNYYVSHDERSVKSLRALLGEAREALREYRVFDDSVRDSDVGNLVARIDRALKGAAGGDKGEVES